MWSLRTNLQLCLLASFLLAAAGPGLAQQTEDEEAPALQITRLDLLDSFAKYPIADDSVFAPGDTVNVAFNLKGYTESETYRMKVSWKITTNSPAKLPFAPGKDGRFDEELAPEDEEWEPLVRYQAQLPFHLPAGTYGIHVEAKDELSGATAEGDLDVHVAGVPVVQSEDLSVQNFTFSLTAGGTPLRQAVFRPGATIYASFDITGYKLGEGNSYELASQLDLLDAEGSQAYSFNPASEKGSNFYPRLAVPASLRFDLDPTIETGIYTLLLTVTDVVGQQSLSSEETFEVR
jgi:hypothetical protein